MDEITERAFANLAQQLKELDRDLAVQIRDLNMALSDLQAKVRDISRLARA